MIAPAPKMRSVLRQAVATDSANQDAVLIANARRATNASHLATVTGNAGRDAAATACAGRLKSA